MKTHEKWFSALFHLLSRETQNVSPVTFSIYMLKEKVLEKFLQVLASVPQKQQKALATELAKTIHPDATAEVDWSISCDGLEFFIK